MAYGLSNGHVTDDVTWPQRCCEAVRSAILATAWLLVICSVRVSTWNIHNTNYTKTQSRPTSWTARSEYTDTATLKYVKAHVITFYLLTEINLCDWHFEYLQAGKISTDSYIYNAVKKFALTSLLQRIACPLVCVCVAWRISKKSDKQTHQRRQTRTQFYNSTQDLN